MLLACLFSGVTGGTAVAATDPAPAIDFVRDIRPLLSENCFRCHGPDEAARESGLRFDQREGALQPAQSGLRAIVPGHPDQSEALLRLTDELDPMPPVETGKRLTAAQQAQLRAWIAAGAPYERHWSLRAPIASAPPAVKASAWPQNPIDAFILSRLEAEGLAPAPPADPTTLSLIHI